MTKLEKQIANTKTSAFRKIIKEEIIDKTPNIGATQLRKAINADIKLAQKLLKQQANLSKTAAKTAIEKGVDYLQQQSEKKAN